MKKIKGGAKKNWMDIVAILLPIVGAIYICATSVPLGLVLILIVAVLMGAKSILKKNDNVIKILRTRNFMFLFFYIIIFLGGNLYDYLKQFDSVSGDVMFHCIALPFVWFFYDIMTPEDEKMDGG